MAEVTRTFGSVTFVTPANWQVLVPKVWTAPVGPRLFLSDARLSDPCAVTSLGAACWNPVGQLPPRGILVTFAGSATMTPNNPGPSPHVQPVGDICKAMGGQEQLGFAAFGTIVMACLAGPDVAANETAFTRLAASLKGL